MRTRSIVTLLCIALWAAAARAELYIWTDGGGREHYVDDYAKVPPEYRNHTMKFDPASLPISGRSLPGDDPPAELRTQEREERAGKGEDWWRGRAEDLRKQIKRIRDDLDFYYGLRRDCAESQKNIISPRNRDCGNLYAETIEQKTEKLEKLMQQLDVDLPEDARKAGASPGWLRESSTSVPDQAENTGRDELWWRNRAKTLREQLKTEQDNLEQYTEQERKCEEEQRYNTGCKRKNCKVMYEYRIKHAERRVENLRQSLEVDLPEEARKAGAYPGWLRE